MISTYDGVSHFAFRYVIGNFVALLTASIMPFVVGAVFSTVYLYSYAKNFLEHMVVHNDVDKAIVLAEQQWHDFIFMGVTMFFSMWLVAKVVRLLLSDETPSLIGSAGTLRSAFWLFLYSVASTLIVAVPAFLAAVVAPILFALLLGKTLGGLIGLLIALAALVLFGWAECRFLIGFLPVALGERPNLFLGWHLTRWESWGLFFRVLAAMVVIAGVSMLLASVLGNGLLASVILVTTGFAEGSEAVSAEQIPVLARNAVLIQTGLNALSLPVQWYFLALFAEAYRRLSKGYAL